MMHHSIGLIVYQGKLKRQRKSEQRPELVTLASEGQTILLDLREDVFACFVRTGIMPVGSEKNKTNIRNSYTCQCIAMCIKRLADETYMKSKRDHINS